jgi:hypothetical protein
LIDIFFIAFEGAELPALPRLTIGVLAERTGSSKARDVAELQLTYAHRKLAELRALEDGLSHFATACNESCAGGPARDCVILEDLSNGDSCCR